MERFYVLSIQYNKEKDAENRTAPKAYDSYQDAKREFHRQLAADMGNATLGWSICMVIDKFCNLPDSERYEAPQLEETEE